MRRLLGRFRNWRCRGRWYAKQTHLVLTAPNHGMHSGDRVLMYGMLFIVGEWRSASEVSLRKANRWERVASWLVERWKGFRRGACALIDRDERRSSG